MKAPKTLEGHVALVTGATGGIGLQFCRELASRRCDLILTDVSERRLAAARIEIETDFPDVKAVTLPVDLTDKDCVAVIDSFCSENSLDPDIVVNNAGIFAFAPVTDIEEEKLNCFIDLHMRAVTMLSRWFATRRAQKGSGWLLNMSSMSCWMPMPGLSMYAATKSYIRVFTRSLHYEMRDFGIGVTVACPGGIATDLFGLPNRLKRLAVRLGVLDTPERFAHKAVDRMLKRKKQYINGWLNRFSIAFVGVMPTPVRMVVKHRLLDKGITR